MKRDIEGIIKRLIDDRRLRKWVERLVIADGGAREDAEGLFSKAVRIVWENLERGVEIQHVEAFLKEVIRKNWNQQDKKQRTRREKLQRISFPGKTDSVEKNYISEELIQLFWAEIDRLGEPCRQILYLFYKEDMKYREIAKVLDNGKDEVWVRRRAYACREKLRERLEQLPDFKDIL